MAEKEARNWTSIETKQFCSILAHPVNPFMITLERKALKKASKVVFEEVLEEFKKEFRRGTLQKPEQRRTKEKEDITITA